MKQRLVGTVVIGCLVIIFLPILLDGEGVTAPALTNTIPSAPPMPTVPDITPQRAEIAPDTTAANTKPDSQDDSNEAPPANTTVSSADTAPPPAPERPQLTDAGVPETWMVRLGSFGEKANADGLVGRLQENGYKAFTRPLNTSRGTLTGVYVGPVLTEREAGSLQQELARSFELEGIVVQFTIDELGQ